MGGRGMVCVVTLAAPCVTTRRVVTTRFTRLTGARTAWRARYFLLGLAFCTCAAAGTSLTCIAPPPTSAPP